jgi:Mn2+/Fe2+ NRAMP family transporter
MSTEDHNIKQDRQLILDAKAKGRGATFGAYLRLSGPGWLQSAITLGGGSLASSLYLGVLGGFALLWLQPMAMILGIVMLSAISYVTLSTGERPFRAINLHINPVLGWGWAIATLMANCVWSLPQFALGTAAMRQNLMPGVFGADAMNDTASKLIIGGAILVVCAAMVWFYDSGGRGVKVFNVILKVMVGLIVLSFVGVVVRMSFTDGLLDWGQIFRGFIPDIRLLWSPAKTFDPLLSAVDPAFQDFWRSTVVALQRDVMISAAATAVGINMTFLLPYSMLRRGWDRHFRGLAMFDLSTGLFIPFLLATSCVVIASSAQFHTKTAEGVLEAAAGNTEIQVPKNLQGGYRDMALKRVKKEMRPEEEMKLTQELERLAKDKKDDERNARIDALIQPLPAADKQMAAILVKRDAFNLASSLAPLTGDWVAHFVFGFGVVGMAVSSIIILMLINGFTVCEMLGRESRGWVYRVGCLMPCIGLLGPFIWTGDAKFWLAVPTSMFGMVLLPVAYFAFYMLMNEQAVLGKDLPTGGRRVAWNVMMAIAALFATIGSLWSLWSKLKVWGLVIFVTFIALALVVQVSRMRKKEK